jgi:hypothetical protein
LNELQLDEESDMLFIEQDVKSGISIVVRGLGMIGLAGSSTLSKPGVVLLALVIAMIIAIMVAYGTFTSCAPMAPPSRQP